MREKSLTVGDLMEKIKARKKSGCISDSTPIVYSSDDEGNDYQQCVMLPSIIHFTKKPEYGQYIAPDYIYDAYHDEDKPIVYLCIN